jgi:hypothetical protein
MRKITPAQTEMLYAFTRKHFVEYYDLQTELVDHLANAIEAKWEQQPDIDFETALQQEFKKFGIFGFMDVVEKRQAALTKKYYKLIWSYFKHFITIPKIMFTLAIVAITYKLLLFQPLLYVVLLFIILIGSGIKFFQLHRKYRAKRKATGKKWLFEENIFRCGGSGIYLYLVLQFLRLDLTDTNSKIWYLIASAILVLLLLYDYIVLFVIPAKAEEHLKATYPEYNLEFIK